MDNYFNGVNELAILYRGSIDGWQAKDIYLKCNDRADQIIIMFQILDGDCVGGFINA